MLRAAQLIGLGRIVKRCDRAVRPCQAPLGRLIVRSEILRVNLKEARSLILSLAVSDHYLARIRCSLCDQRELPVSAARKRRGAANVFSHPFGAGPGLSEATAGKQQPVLPLRIRRSKLIRPGPELPVPAQRLKLAVSQTRQYRRPFAFGQRCESFGFGLSQLNHRGQKLPTSNSLWTNCTSYIPDVDLRAN